MTILTAKSSPFTISFLVVNFIIFWVSKFFLLNIYFENQSGVQIYITITMLALTTSYIYIIIDMHFMRKQENKIITMSSYCEEYDCNLFLGYDNVWILKQKKNNCQLYINRLYFVYTQAETNRIEYIQKLKSRFLTLNKIDKLYIYLYKYITLVLSALLLFYIWQFYNTVSMSNDLYMHFILIFAILLFALPVYAITSKICLYLIVRSMRKRNLEMFTFR